MPKIVDHDQYRNELLGKCIDLFSDRGYMNITMREIAEEIGVSTGTLYHYFSSKLDILMQLIPYAQFTNVAEGVERIGAQDSVPGKFAEAVRFWNDNEGLYRKLALLVFDLYRNDASETEQIFSEFYTYYCTAIAEVIVKEFDLPERYASFIFIYIMGLAVHTVLVPDKKDYQGMLKFMVDMLLREHGAQKKKSVEGVPGGE
jgi:AcrR family transcriptional regulator